MILMNLRYSISVFLCKPNFEQLEEVDKFVERSSRTPLPWTFWRGYSFYSTEVTTTDGGMGTLLKRINRICGPNVKTIDITNPQMAYIKQGRS